MKIKCIKEFDLFLATQRIKNPAIFDEPFFLKETKEYCVYAIWVHQSYTWYAICDECYSFYPMWYPSVVFEVTNPTLSRYWVFGLHNDLPLLSFPEWINNQYFYIDLIDGSACDSNSNIFSRYKKLIDLEQPDSTISISANIGDATWLICPLCIDAWESQTNQDALVECPKCKTTFNNPRYKNEQARC